MRNRYTDEQRERLVAEVRSTGEAVKVVAKRQGVCVSSAYQWVKDAAPATSGPVFARVVPTAALRPSSMVLEVGRAKLLVEAGFDVELLRRLVSALSDAT